MKRNETDLLIFIGFLCKKQRATSEKTIKLFNRKYKQFNRKYRKSLKSKFASSGPNGIKLFSYHTLIIAPNSLMATYADGI